MELLNQKVNVMNHEIDRLVGLEASETAIQALRNERDNLIAQVNPNQAILN